MTFQIPDKMQLSQISQIARPGEKRKLTAREIVNTLYPDKNQPYINSYLTELVYEKKLVREDTRPYTVHIPLADESLGESKNYTREKQSVKRLDIPNPSTDEVEKYLRIWNQLENYTLQERALNKLFLETYIHNTDIDEVLVKVATLNDFYSTQIFSVYPVAKHIVQLNLDERLRLGDITLVNEIARVTMESGVEKNFILLLLSIAVIINQQNMQFMTVMLRRY